MNTLSPLSGLQGLSRIRYVEQLLQDRLEAHGVRAGTSPLLHPERHLVLFQAPERVVVVQLVRRRAHEVTRLDESVMGLRRGTQELQVRSPIEEAREAAGYVESWLRGAGVGAVQVLSALLFTECARVQLRPDLLPETARAAFLDEIAALGSLALLDLLGLSGQKGDAHDPVAEKLLFDPHLRLPRGGTTAVVALDEQQRKFGERLSSSPSVVRGMPGCGKTVALVYQALWRSRCQSGCRRLLIACRSPLLASWIRHVVGLNQILAMRAAAIEVKTLRELRDDLMRLGTSDDPAAPDEALLARALEIASSLDESDKYDAVLVDEGQWITDDEFGLLQAMLEYGRNDLAISIDSTERCVAPAIVELSRRAHLVALSHQHRTPRRFLNELLGLIGQGHGDLHRLPPEGLEGDSRVPPCRWPETMDALIIAVDEELRRWVLGDRRSPADVAVVCFLADDDRRPMADLCRGLLERLKQTEVRLSWTDSSRQLDLLHPAVKVASAAELEGLDFEVMALVCLNLGERQLPRDDKSGQVLFRAVTRARRQLSAFGLEKAPSKPGPGGQAGPTVDETSRVNYAIQYKFPYPIARAWYRLVREEDVRAENLFGALDSVLHYLAAIAIIGRLARNEQNDKFLETFNQLHELKRFTAGAWLTLLKDAMRKFDERFMPELWRLLSATPDGPKFTQRLDALVHLRNDFAHKPAKMPSATQFRDRLAEVCEDLAFLANYPLVAVGGYHIEDQEFRVHQARLLMGSRNKFESCELRTTRHIETARVAVVNPQGSLRYLYPFYQMRPCADCRGLPRFFWFDRLERGHLHYDEVGGHSLADAEAYRWFRSLTVHGPSRTLDVTLPELHMTSSEDWHVLSKGYRVDDAYVVEEFLRRGSWADIYRGRAVDGSYEVALKILPVHHFRDLALVVRFREEMVRTRELSHPNIVRVLRFNETFKDHYLALELATGWYRQDGFLARDARELLGEPVTPLPEHKVRHLLTSVGRGLAYMHAEGLIHRDVKTANLLLFSGDVVKLADFGVALSPGSRQRPFGRRQPGTVSYMAPEQRDGQSELTPAADIYSLGVVAFELLTGIRRMHTDKNLKMANDDLLASNISSPLAALVGRCLSKPAKRPQDGAAFLRELGQA